MATVFIPLQRVTAAMGATVLFPAPPAAVARRSVFATMQLEQELRLEQGRTFASDGADAGGAGGSQSDAEAQIRREAAEDEAARAGLGTPVATRWSAYSAATLGLGTAVPMELAVGDALLMDYRCFHYGGANRTGDLRAVLYATFSEDRGEEDVGGVKSAHGTHESFSMPAAMQSRRLGDFL